MNFFEKLSVEPSFCSFHDDTLDMLDVRPNFVHIRISISDFTYFRFENYLKDIYKDPKNNELYIDIVYFGAMVSQESYLPNSVRFGEDYSIFAVGLGEDGFFSVRFEHLSDPYDYHELKMTFQKCVAKVFKEVGSSYYDAHPELFDKPFDIDEFEARPMF